MTSQFGGFVHSSPLASLPHDPVVSLASNCIRDFFGPGVQTVADCLQTRGGASTLSQIVTSIRSQCQRDWNEERERLVVNGGYRLHRAKGPSSSGYLVDVEPIREALVVLIQHNIVSAENVLVGKIKSIAYRFDSHRARLLPRYPKFVEYSKKALDITAAALVEQILLSGRMRTVSAIESTTNELKEKALVGSDDASNRKSVVESFRRLAEDGYIEIVSAIVPIDGGFIDEDEEAEFVDPSPACSRKKRRKLDSNQKHRKHVRITQDRSDSAIEKLLRTELYRDVLPMESVWRVNIAMYHDHLRAYSLGRLVSERHGNKVQSAGSMVTSALKLVAHRKHAMRIRDLTLQAAFSPKDLLAFLPKPIQQSLERKPGGAVANLSRSLQELSGVTYPSVILELEDAEGHLHNGVFLVASSRILDHLRDRLHRQVVHDRQGEIAARICAILSSKGHLESEAIAEMAMVPAKDTREILHSLYRQHYIEMTTLQQSKQYNPSNTIFLWNIPRPRLGQTVLENLCTALLNLRLRRQHEVANGKDWIERVKESSDVDENHHELDKMNYKMFCQGLERLDNAMLQLDESIMVLLDF